MRSLDMMKQKLRRIAANTPISQTTLILINNSDQQIFLLTDFTFIILPDLSETLLKNSALILMGMGTLLFYFANSEVLTLLA